MQPRTQDLASEKPAMELIAGRLVARGTRRGGNADCIAGAAMGVMEREDIVLMLEQRDAMECGGERMNGVFRRREESVSIGLGDLEKEEFGKCYGGSQPSKSQGQSMASLSQGTSSVPRSMWASSAVSSVGSITG
jgi:hypothetical protein